METAGSYTALGHDVEGCLGYEAFWSACLCLAAGKRELERAYRIDLVSAMAMRDQNDAGYRALLIASAISPLCPSQRVCMLLSTVMQDGVAVNRESGGRKNSWRPGDLETAMYKYIGERCSAPCTAYKAVNKRFTKKQPGSCACDCL